MAQELINRPDVDIVEELGDIIAHYPPLQQDRHRLTITSAGGVVDLSGHVKTPISRRYLVDKARSVPGVRGVNSERLYDEQVIRLEVGRRIPNGVLANVQYSTVILTGELPEGVTAQEVVAQVAQIPGIERVVTKF